MAYERIFTPPYPNGWEDRPSHNTPATAGIMDDYDSAIDHIEDFLNGSTAIFPIQATGGMTQPIGVDENGRLFTYPSSGGGGTAAEISYDNTESGLEATDAQGAIDELASDFRDGCDIIVSAVTAKGQTPASNSPADIATAISNITTSGGIPILSKASWDALTTAQKRAYGLLAIQETNIGFIRGELVNGADYIPSYIGLYAYTDEANHTFTINESGKYLVLVAVPYDGSGSITLPQGATILSTIDESVSDARHVYAYIAELNANDTVTTQITYGNWAGRIAVIIKLSEITTVQDIDFESTADGSTTYTLPNDNNLYLVCGFAISRTDGVSRDDTTNAGNEQEMITGNWGYNSITRVSVCSGVNSPNYSFYGYDGGFSAVISWQIS